MFAWRSRLEPSGVWLSLRCSDPSRPGPDRGLELVERLAERRRRCGSRCPEASRWQESRQTPSRSSPPAASISAASSSNERPSVPPVPAVFSRCSGQPSVSASASRDHRARARDRRADLAGLRRARVQDHRVRAERRARVAARRSARSASWRGCPGPRWRRSAGRRRGSAARRPGSPASASRNACDLLVAVDRRLPGARVLVEDLDAARAERLAALDGLRRAAGGGDVGADQHGRGRRARRAMSVHSYRHARPLRSQPHRPAPHRRRAHRALQLARGARQRRPVRAAHRGHRPRALDAGERRAHPRGAALAGARLGRGPDLAGRQRRSATAQVVERLLEEGQAYRTQRRPARTCKAWKAEHGAGAATAATPEADGAVRLRVPDEGATVVHDLIRGDTRLPARAPRRPGDRARRRQPALQPRRRDRRPRRRDHARDPRRGPHLQHAQAAARARGDRRARSRSTPTCRCCTAPTARSSASATAPPRCRTCATPATCPRRCATTSRCSAGATATTRR